MRDALRVLESRPQSDQHRVKAPQRLYAVLLVMCSLMVLCLMLSIVLFIRKGPPEGPPEIARLGLEDRSKQRILRSRAQSDDDIRILEREREIAPSRGYFGAGPGATMDGNGERGGGPRRGVTRLLEDSLSLSLSLSLFLELY